MTPDLDLLARLEREATPGPWRSTDCGWIHLTPTIRGPDGEPYHGRNVCRFGYGNGPTNRSIDTTNRDFLMALRNAAPALLAAARVGMMALDHDNGRVRDPRFIGAIEALRSHAPGGTR